jgi:hypothetical protein
MWLATALQRIPRMLLYRSLSLGMLGACLYFLATFGAAAAPEPRTAPETIVVHARPAVTVVDVARGVEPWRLPELVKLQDGEHVHAVDDFVVASDLAAGATIAMRGALSPRDYLDLTIDTADGGQRRLLIVLH